MRFRFVLFLPLVALAACATPQERCIQTATRDLRVVNGLIAETQATIERGYAYQVVEDERLRLSFCRRGERTELCWIRDNDTRRVPVAVNLDEEREKLATLIAKRDELELRARQQIAACEASGA